MLPNLHRKSVAVTTLIFLSFTALVLPFFAAPTQAAGPPSILSYQGRLTDSSGNLLGGSGTTYYFKFSLWSAASGGSQLWPVTANSFATTVRRGVFNVNIGDTANGYPDTLDYDFGSTNVFLQVEVSSNNVSFETLTPRQQVTSAAFAQVAGSVYGTGRSTIGQASTTVTSAYNGFYSGRTSTTTILGDNATSTFAGSIDLSRGLNVSSYLFGAGLASCSGSADKLIWENGRFSCGTDAGGSGSGVTALRGQYSSAQTGATQIFATSSDANIQLTITSSGDIHTFTPIWNGTLAASRGGTGISNPTAAGLLVGTYAGGGWQQIATSSLGLSTTDITEGTNLYWTNTRFDNRLSATTSLPNITTLAGLSLSATQLTNFGTPFYQFFSATTTDALPQGSTNRYYSDSLARAALSASSPITYNSGTGAFGFDFTTNNTWTGLNQFARASSTIASVYQALYVGTTATTTILGTATSTFGAGVQATYLNITGTSATSTFANGIQLSGGCFRNSDGTCLGSGNGTVTSITAATPNSTITLGGTNPITTSGTINFDINLSNPNTWTGLQQFSRASSTIASVYQALYVGTTGTTTILGTATSTFGAGIQTTNLNVTGTTATSTFANGIQLSGGCFRNTDGTCIGSGNGTVTSVALSDANNTITIGGSPITSAGTLTATLNLANPNNWTALQQFARASSTLLSVYNGLYVGTTGTTTILGTATSTFGAGVQATYLNITGTSATSTFANGIQLSGGCFRTADGSCVGVTSGDWTGTFDGQEGTYYLDARNQTNFGTPFYQFFSATTTNALAEGSLNKYLTTYNFSTILAATTTDALAQGSTNRYYSDTLARAAFSGTSPITYNSGTGAFGFDFTTNNIWTGLNQFSRASSTIASVYNALYVGTTGTTTILGTATSTFGAGIRTTYLDVTGTSATSTFANGIQLSGGCFRTSDGTCVGTTNGTVTSVQLATPNSTLSLGGTNPVTTSGTINVDLNLSNPNSWTGLQQFSRASSTLSSVYNALYVGTTGTTTILGTATSTFGAGVEASYLNITGTTATSTFARGIDLGGGCFAINGTCIGSGGGAVSSVSANADGSLTISPTTGAVIAGINFANSNIWTGLQQFSRASSTLASVYNALYVGTTATTTISGTATSTFGAGIQTTYLDVIGTSATSTFSNGLILTGGGLKINTLLNCNAGQVLETDANGVVQCGSDAGASGTVTSVTASDASLTVSPNTGDVLVSLNRNNPNTWTALQQFSRASSTIASVYDALYVGTTATTTILGTATSTFGAGIQASYLNITGTLATSTFANGIQLSGGCFRGVDGSCMTSNAGTVTSVALSDANNTLTIGGSPITSNGTLTATLNLANANIWTGLQTFRSASSTSFSSLDGVIIGRTASTTIRGDAGTSTFSSFIAATAASTTATSTMAGINLPYGGCFAVNGNCVGTTNGTVTSITAATPNSTLSIGGTNPITTSGTINFDLNLSNANIWTGLQTFRSASSTSFSALDGMFIGRTASTTIRGDLGTSTFSSFISAVSASTTATSTLAGINLPYGGCVAVGGTCLTSNSGTVTSITLATPNSTLSLGGTNPVTTSGTINVDLNLGNANIWTALQTFRSASSTSFSSLDGIFIGRTASTTIRGDSGTSTFSSFISATAASTTATSTFAGINLPYGGCVAVGGTCLTSNAGTVTSVALSDSNNTLTIGGSPITTNGTLTATLNLANANIWTGLQTFRSASSTSFSSLDGVFVGRTASTTIRGDSGTSTFSSFISATAASTTATSTLAGINLPYGGCFAVNGVCMTSNGGTVTSITAATPNSTLSIGGTNPITTSGTINFDLNLGNANIWTGLQTFRSASSTSFSALDGMFIGRTASTTIRGDLGTSTFSSFISAVSASTTATSTMAGINLPYGGCVAVGGTCLTSNAGTVTSVALSDTNNTLTIGGSPITTNGTLTATLNLANANIWTGLQTFRSASSTSFSSLDGIFIGRTASTTIRGDLGTSTFSSFIAASAASTTATSTFAGINVPYNGCVAVRGTCLGFGTVTSITAATPNSTLTLSGTNPVTTSGTINFDLNLGNANIWTALQTFRSASSTSFSSLDGLFVGRTATTSIVGDLGTSTFRSFISAVSASTTATSTLAGINLPYGGCFAVNGVCMTSNSGTVTSITLATPNSTLSLGGTNPVTTSGTINVDLNLATANIWTGLQTFRSASSTSFSSLDGVIVGRTASTTIRGDAGTSTFSSFISAVSASTTATSTLAGINLPYGGCFAVNGTCLGGGNGSGTVNTGVSGYFAYYPGNGTTVDDQTVLNLVSGNIGIGTTSPWATLAVNPVAGGAANQFAIGSSSATSFVVNNSGNVGIGTTSPNALLSISGLDGARNLLQMIGAENTFKADVVIDGNGNMSLGTTTHVSTGLSLMKLLVDGNTYLSGQLNMNTNSVLKLDSNSASGGNNYLRSDGSNAFGFGANNFIVGVNPNAKFVVLDGDNLTPYMIFDTATGNFGLGTTSPYAALSVVGASGVVANKYFATSTAATSTFQGTVLADSGGSVGIGTTTPGNAARLGISGNLFVGGLATSTFVRGINLTGGCFAVNDTCMGAGGGGGTVNSGVGGYFTYYPSNGTTVDDQAVLNLVSGNIGVGSTTPWGLLSVNASALSADVPQFVVGSSTATNFIVANNGNIGIGLTTPSDRNKVTVSYTDTTTSGSFISNTALRIIPTYSGALTGGSAEAYGIYLAPTISSAVTAAEYGIYGQLLSPTYSGALSNSGEAIELYGLDISPVFSGSIGGANNSVSVWGTNIAVTSALGTVAETEKFGSVIEVRGTADVNYGLKVKAQDATTNYAIYSEDGTNYLADNTGVGSTSPWALLSVHPDGVTGPAFAIGSSTKTDFQVTSGGRTVIGHGGVASSTLLTVWPAVAGGANNLATGLQIDYSPHIGVLSGTSTAIYLNNSSGTGKNTTGIENVMDLAFGGFQATGFSNRWTVHNTRTTIGFDNMINYMEGSDNTAYGLRNISLTPANNSGTQTFYGLYNDVSGRSDSTANIYGTYSVGRTYSGNTSTFYGNYVTSSSDSDGGTQYGLYADLTAGSATKYPAILLGGNVGISTTSPYAALSVVGASGVVAEKYYATSTAATSTFQGTVLAESGGSVGIGTTTPGNATRLGIAGNIFVGGAATSTFVNGINLAGGCFAINGTCVGGGAGAVSSVSNADGTLTISPTTGAVVASLNLGSANIWTGLQQFNAHASSTQFSVLDAIYVGRTATTTIVGETTGTSTFAGSVKVTNSLAIGETPDTNKALGITNINSGSRAGIDYFGIIASPSASVSTHEVVLERSIAGGSSGLTFSGDILNINDASLFSIPGTGNATVSGNFLDINRSYTANTADTLTVSGALATFTDNCSVFSTGVCTSTADVLSILQSYSGNSGSALNLSSAASDTSGGFVFRANDDGTLTDSTPFVINPHGFVGVGTTTPVWGLTTASSTAPQLSLSAGVDVSQWVFRNAGGNLYLATTTLAGTATTSISALEIAGGGFGTTTLRGLNISGFATSTSNVGFNISSGCYAINNTCVGGGGQGSGTVSEGAAGYFAYYPASNTTVDDQTVLNLVSGNLGVGTTTPWGFLSINPSGITGPSFAIGSSTKTDFIVTNGGFVGIGTSTPYAKLSVVGQVVASHFNATSTTATSTFAGGFIGTGMTILDNLEIGALTFDIDAGAVSWAELPITSSAPSGTVQSYTAQLDSNSIFTLYGQADGSGGLKRARSVFGTSTNSVLSSDNIPFGSVLISDGALCVDNGSGNTCATTARTRGFVYAEGNSVSGLDVAELYPTNDESLEAGEILMLDPLRPKFVKRYDIFASSTPILFGVVSSDPGLILGGFSDDVSEDQVPVALSGRVPVKINLSGGPVAIGDRIAPSAVPGVGMRAASTSEMTIGVALEVFTEQSTTTSILVFVENQDTFASRLASLESQLSILIAAAASSTAPVSGTSSPITTASATSNSEAASSTNNVTLSSDELAAFIASTTAPIIASTTTSIITSTTTLEYLASTTADRLASSTPSFIARVADAVTSIIQTTGKWIVQEIRATLAIFQRVETQTASVTKGLELTDQATGEIYCLTIRNGELNKVLGTCDMATSTPSQLVPEDPVTPPVVTPPSGDSGSNVPVPVTGTSTPSTATTTIDTGAGSPSDTATSTPAVQEGDTSTTTPPVTPPASSTEEQNPEPTEEPAVVTESSGSADETASPATEPAPAPAPSGGESTTPSPEPDA